MPISADRAGASSVDRTMKPSGIDLERKASRLTRTAYWAFEELLDRSLLQCAVGEERACNARAYN
jgi:hypothetical protein